VTSFCELVRENLAELERVIGRSEIVSVNDSACRIEAEEIAIQIGADPRNYHVGSSITWKTYDPATELETHIISRFFDLPTEATTERRLDDAVRRELTRIAYVIDNCRKRQVSERDLSYFSRGYNQAYNDYLIPKL
jgi:hypothetical protein